MTTLQSIRSGETYGVGKWPWRNRWRVQNRPKSLYSLAMPLSTKTRRRLRSWRTRARELRGVVRGLVSTRHPLLVHIIPIRRCNLACTYCNEFDDFSKPVDTAEMIRRIDRLGELGTAVITISGGEPLLHPELDQIIARMRKNGILSGMITNGYLLTAERIERLNRAGLEYLQISIDNAMPDEVSKKSLKVLDQKLKLLADHAVFQVNINSVLGSGVKNPEDALPVARRAQELGFTSTVGILHDGQGQLKPLGGREIEIFEEIMAHGQARVFAHQRLPAQHRQGQDERLALPLRLALSLHLRGRAGALVLAAARLSGHSAGKIHGRGSAPRIFHEKTLRAALHGFLRAADRRGGQLARAANAEAGRRAAVFAGIARAAAVGRWIVTSDSVACVQTAGPIFVFSVPLCVLCVKSF